MSEVKRYDIAEYGGGMDKIIDGTYVGADDYDAAREELAALREDLAVAKHDIASFLETTAKVCNLLGIDTEDAKNADGKPSDVLFSHAEALRQRLAAAEQRNAAFVELLSTVTESVTGRNGTFARIPADWFDKRDAAAKPAESFAYQSREIGESDWADCSKEEYDRCAKDPVMDTRIKPTESGASE